MSDTPKTDAEAPDLINLMEWNRFAEQGMTLLEVLTILNNRHRAEIEAIMAAEIHAMRELNAAKEIIADLLDHPYPHDIMEIRKEAAGYTSEEYAAEDMEAYCTEESALKARTEWNIAQKTAREFLKS